MTEKKTKILHLLCSNRFSGAENVVCQIISLFAGNPEVEMVYCSPDGQIRQALSERSITFLPVASMTVKEVKQILRSYRPDIVHAHDMRASLIAAACCGKTPLISHIHNNSFNSRGISLKSVAYLWAAKKAKHIFWVSNSAFRGYAFSKCFAEKSSVLYNIIDTEALYQRMAMDRKTYSYDVVFLGRLTEPKNPKRLMYVLEKVAQKLPSVKIAIVGTGDLEEETKALCKQLQLQNAVDFLGFMDNPLKLLSDSKVMVMTSLWEGTPMCALEAMALGVPIVSTPTDGLCDLIEEGKTGFLSDDNAVLAEKIVLIVQNESVRKSLSDQSTEVICSRMNKDVYTAKLLEQYSAC